MTTRTVIVGAGANELVAAHLLGQAGGRVVVLDTAESSANGAADPGWVAPQIVSALHLERHGLKISRPDPWIALPVAPGERLELWNDVARSAESIRRFSSNDAARWPEFCERMARLGRALESIAMRGNTLVVLTWVKPLPVDELPSGVHVVAVVLFHVRTQTYIPPVAGSSSQAKASSPPGPAASEGLKDPLVLALTPPTPPFPAPPAAAGTAGPTAVHAEPFQRVT